MIETFPRLEQLTQQKRDMQSVTEAIRVLSLWATHRGSLTKAADAFLDRWPRSSTALLLQKDLAHGELMLKAATPPMTTDDLPSAAWLRPLAEAIARTTLLERVPGFVRAPIKVPIPYETVGPTFQWVAQNSSKPVSTLTTGTNTLAMRKAASIIVHTEEFVRATADGGERLLAARLTNSAAKFIDGQLLDPTLAAVADKNPASLTNAGTSITPGSTHSATLEQILSTFFAARPAPSSPTFLLGVESVGRLSATGVYPGLTASGGVLCGFPAYVARGGGAIVALVDAGAVVFHQSVVLDTSNQAALVADTAPPSPPTATAVITSLWENNLTGIAIDIWTDWAIEPNSCTYATLPAPA